MLNGKKAILELKKFPYSVYSTPHNPKWFDVWGFVTVKKLIIIAGLILLIACAGFLYLKKDVLKTADFKPDNSKASSSLDLRPSLIAKLQQVVKDASGGLYILSIDKLEPDVLASKLDVIGGTISVDTAAMLRLDQSKKLPDDVFNIKFHSLRIDGIGIGDLLHKKTIDITGASLNDPVIDIYHKARSYNKDEHKKNDSLTLYQRLMGQMQKIAITAINITHGTLVIHDVEQPKRLTKFNDITIRMNDILIDSSTQYDASRFLFAKHAVLETRNYIFPTPDSLYYVRLGKISLTGEKHEVTVVNAQLQHRGSRQEFEKKLHGRDEMYDISLPRVVLHNVNWWQLVNREKIVSTKTDIYGGTVSVFSDLTIPLGAKKPMNHFPHQLVMMIPIPVLVSELNFHGLKFVLQQYNPETRSTGMITCTNIDGAARHITNIRDEIRRLPYTSLTAKALFMNTAPMRVRFKFNLAHYQSGQFSVDVNMDTLNKITINPIAEPLGRFTVKNGQMQRGTAHMEGDNFSLHGTVEIFYTDLHLTPLKSDSAHGELKKNHLKSFFANTVLIKNENPHGNDLRQPTVTVGRDHHQNFVAYVWTAILTGLCKTIGIPVKLVVKSK